MEHSRPALPFRGHMRSGCGGSTPSAAEDVGCAPMLMTAEEHLRSLPDCIEFHRRQDTYRLVPIVFDLSVHEDHHKRLTDRLFDSITKGSRRQFTEAHGHEHLVEDPVPVRIPFPRRSQVLTAMASTQQEYWFVQITHEEAEEELQ